MLKAQLTQKTKTAELFLQASMDVLMFLLHLGSRINQFSEQRSFCMETLIKKGL